MELIENVNNKSSEANYNFNEQANYAIYKLINNYILIVFNQISMTLLLIIICI